MVASETVVASVPAGDLSLQATRTRSLRPIVRWAGGKSVIVRQLVAAMPTVYERYIEPLAGGAALFFCVAPERAILSDINAELITFYQVLAAEPERLLARLAKLSASRELYYSFRSQKPRSSLQRAVRFAYLNRLAWNGLYRVNRQGEFNVPIGDRLPSTLWDFDSLRNASRLLSGVCLSTSDYRAICAKTARSDFVFLDPPYPRRSNEALGFNRYTPDRFTIHDHRDLATTVRRLTKRRVKVMLTIADVPELRNIYDSNLNSRLTTTKSLIACNGASRGLVGELILTNYD